MSAGVLVAAVGITAPAAVAVQTHGSAAPPPVTDLIVRSQSNLIALTWRLPGAAGIAGAEVVRYPGAEIVFRGKTNAAVDNTVKPGVRYRYVVNTYDTANSRSSGVTVAVTAKQSNLIQPQDFARLTVAPLLAWQPASSASYYNIQVWAQLPSGPVKVFSDWPKVNRFQLPPTWKFEGKAQRLTPGTYRWYVWPGEGPFSQAKYGPLIGSNTFFVVP
jgi:hypothetical protein